MNRDWQAQLWWLAGVPICLIVGCVLLGALSWEETPAQRRAEAMQRWQARPFASYRIAIRVAYAGNSCAQELETEGEQLRRIVANSCRVSWLGLTTVTRLFDISAQLDRPTPCYSMIQSCSCYRVLERAISYDPQLGYPTTITYRRRVQPNVTNMVYWQRLWDTHQLPSCGPAFYPITISVVSVQPLA